MDAVPPVGGTRRLPTSRHVRSHLDLVLPLAIDVVLGLGAHPGVGVLRPRLLLLEHSVLRAGVPLLRVAYDEAQRRAAAADDVAAHIVDYLHEHEREELHRDDSILDDYAALDRDPAEVLRQVPSPCVAAMVGGIYYWILHYHPVVVLGYVAAGVQLTPALVPLGSLGKDRDVRPTPARPTRPRGAADPRRADDLWRLLDGLRLSNDQLDAITTAALHTVRHHVAALVELMPPR